MPYRPSFVPADDWLRIAINEEGPEDEEEREEEEDACQC